MKGLRNGRPARPARYGRRGFLRQAALVGGASAAYGAFGGTGVMNQLARAAGSNPDPAHTKRHFVFCLFDGGWDTLLSLDPRDPAQYTDAVSGQTRIQLGYNLLPGNPQNTTAAGITFGPYIGDLANHASDLAIVRGMSMETLTHEVAIRRFLTGKAPSGLLARGSSISTWLASKLGEATPVPNLVVRAETYNVDQPTFATGMRVQGAGDLFDVLSPAGGGLGALDASILEEELGIVANCPKHQLSPTLLSAAQGREKAREMVEGGFADIFDFTSDAPQIQALRTAFGLEVSDNKDDGLDSSPARAAIAYQALTNELSRVVTVQVTAGLDTHFDEWSEEQGPRQKAGFDAVAKLVTELQQTAYPGGGGDSWLDHTTIIGFSEFSRTAMLNPSSGRDHSLTNACFLIGAGVKPGVVGASSNVGLSPQLTDLETGQLSPQGEIIKPEHVLRGLFESVGITDDIADLRVEPLRAVLTS